MRDTIYRDEAVEAVIKWYGCKPNDIEAFEEIIEALPSADRPQGEWERIPYSFAGGYRCSICGQKSLENHWNCCPNCGARMKGADYE